MLFVPISALQGGFVTQPSPEMSWYQGPTLLEMLESVEVDSRHDHIPFRFPVQLVSRPPSSEIPDFRGYMGRVASGRVAVGDPVTILPSGARTAVTGIVTKDAMLQEAVAGQSITLMLADDLDISRGDVISHVGDAPELRTEFKATLCWMGERRLHLNQRYELRHTTKGVRAIVNEIDYRLDVNTLERESPVSELQTNDIAQVRLKTLQPLVCDPYKINRQTGGFILLDETNNTVAAGMMV